VRERATEPIEEVRRDLCDSGYRASLAASVLRQEGFERSKCAWQLAGVKTRVPIADGNGKRCTAYFDLGSRRWSACCYCGFGQATSRMRGVFGRPGLLTLEGLLWFLVWHTLMFSKKAVGASTSTGAAGLRKTRRQAHDRLKYLKTIRQNELGVYLIGATIIRRPGGLAWRGN